MSFFSKCFINMSEFYDSCGWLPFGLGKKTANNVGECDTNTKLEDGKCVVDPIGVCGANTTFENGKCTLDNAKFTGTLLPNRWSLTNTGKLTTYDLTNAAGDAVWLHTCKNSPNDLPASFCPSLHLARYNLNPIKTYCATKSNYPNLQSQCEVTMLTRAFDITSKTDWCVANPDAESIPLTDSGGTTVQPCAPLRQNQQVFNNAVPTCANDDPNATSCYMSWRQWHIENISTIAPLS